jgi:hypothetical protein
MAWLRNTLMGRIRAKPRSKVFQQIFIDCTILIHDYSYFTSLQISLVRQYKTRMTLEGKGFSNFSSYICVCFTAPRCWPALHCTALHWAARNFCDGMMPTRRLNGPLCQNKCTEEQTRRLANHEMMHTFGYYCLVLDIFLSKFSYPTLTCYWTQYLRKLQHRAM